MCVFCCVSIKTGSIWRTILLLAVMGLDVSAGWFSFTKTVIVSSCATLGRDGVTLTRCKNFKFPSAQIRMFQSALPVAEPQAPHDAHQRISIGPPIIVGPESVQTQFGS